MSLVAEESWSVQRSEGFGEDPSGILDAGLGCVPDWPATANSGGFCGTIDMNLALGIGIWKGPTENDRLIEAFHRELATTMAELNSREQGNLIRHILYGMGWRPSGREGDDPDLQPLVDNLVKELIVSGQLRALVEEWLLTQRRGW